MSSLVEPERYVSVPCSDMQCHYSLNGLPSVSEVRTSVVGMSRTLLSFYRFKALIILSIKKGCDKIHEPLGFLAMLIPK